ncbi:MAG: hypothetical protein SFV32_02220 [Opitutaceae bacterium]|nr:hypothetical protein [Opitutaceae bacterium]
MNSTTLPTKSHKGFSYSRISRSSRNAATVSSPVFAGYELACADRRLSEGVHACVLILSVIATCVTLVLGY